MTCVNELTRKLKNLTEKLSTIEEYCEPNIDYMFASVITGIIHDKDFRDMPTFYKTKQIKLSDRDFDKILNEIGESDE